MELDGQIMQAARGQFGVVSVAQLRRLGASSSQIHRRVSQGVLVRLHAGVYRVAAVPSSYAQRAMAAVLAVGPGAALSHRTAARLHGYRGAKSYAGIDLTVPWPAHFRVAGVKVHRSKVLDHHDVRRLDCGIPVVRPERAVIGSAGDVSMRVAKRMLDSAVHSGHTTLDHLWRYLTRHHGPGCIGSGVVKTILMERDPRAGPKESDLEDAWVEALETRGIAGFVPQWHVATVDGVRRVDLGHPELRVALEFDSLLWHSSEEDYRRERRKRYVLGLAGVLVLPVTEFDLHERVDEISTQVNALIGEVRPTAPSRSLSPNSRLPRTRGQ